MRLLKQLTNIQNVGPGQHMQIICPVRGTYDMIEMFYTGTAIARSHFTNLQVKCNGEAIWDFADGDDLDQLNDYYKYDDTAGCLTFWFNRKHLKELADQRIFGIGTADLDTFTIEADIAAGAPADIAVTAQAQVSEQSLLGVFTRIRRIPYNSAVSGQVDVDKIPLGPRIMALHLKKADVNDLEVYLDDAKIWEASKAQGEKYQKDHNRTPITASMTHADWILEDDSAQALITEILSDPNRKKADLLLKPTLATSGAVTIYAEYMDTLTQKKAA